MTIRSGALFVVGLPVVSLKWNHTPHQPTGVLVGESNDSTHHLFFLHHLVRVSWNLDRSGELKHSLTWIHPMRKARIGPRRYDHRRLTIGTKL